MSLILAKVALLSKNFLKHILGILSNEILVMTYYFKYTQWYQATLKIIESKNYKPVLPKLKPPGDIYHVRFSNKTIEMINLSAMFNGTNVKVSLETDKCKFVRPNVVYNVIDPIRSKIFHFINFA